MPVNRVSADHARLLSRLSGLGVEPHGPQLQRVYDTIRARATEGATMCEFRDFPEHDIEIISNDLVKNGFNVVVVNGAFPKFSACW